MLNAEYCTSVFRFQWSKLNFFPNGTIIQKKRQPIAWIQSAKGISDSPIKIFDIDHFKNINDTYGHDTGDKVLKTVANTLQAARRPYDLTGRWGGEEFISIIRNANNDQLGTIAERQRRLIQGSSTRYKEKRFKVTVSIGATLAKAKDTENSLIKRADQLMYQSKHSGRNRVTLG